MVADRASAHGSARVVVLVLTGGFAVDVSSIGSASYIIPPFNLVQAASPDTAGSTAVAGGSDNLLQAQIQTRLVNQADSLEGNLVASLVQSLTAPPPTYDQNGQLLANLISSQVNALA